MRVAVHYGRSRAEFEVDASRIVPGARAADSGVDDPVAAVRAALAAPFRYPALRRGLTPDDRVTIVVDESLPNLAALLVPVLEEVVGAGIEPDAITLVCPPSKTNQPWVDELPDAFLDVKVEVHDGHDRKRLSYLATTKAGRRVYLNKQVVDADLTIVLSSRAYDPVFGQSGAAGLLFPMLADDEARVELASRGRLDWASDDADAEPWPVLLESEQIAWLLGAPFFVQVIAGSADGVAEVVAGSIDALAEGRRRQSARWSQALDAAVDLVVAGISGDPARHGFAELAAAADAAASVVRPGGRIVLLSEAAIDLAPILTQLQTGEEMTDVVARLGATPAVEDIPLARWAGAASHAHLTLLSRCADDAIEELSATPLHDPAQVQRLIDAGGSVVFLDDAHKAHVYSSDDA